MFFSNLEGNLLDFLWANIDTIRLADLGGPESWSVGVQGDGRIYGPVIILTVHRDAPTERIYELGTKLINQVPGITRVLIAIEVEIK